MKKQLVSSGTKWEDTVGYSRAVRIGPFVEVAGTTSIDDEGRIAGKTVYDQSVFIFKKIELALAQLNVTMQQVVRTRMYLTDISNWEAAGKAHGEFFRNIRPAATMVAVSRLIDPGLLIEIEVTAIAEPDRFFLNENV